MNENLIHMNEIIKIQNENMKLVNLNLPTTLGKAF